MMSIVNDTTIINKDTKLLLPYLFRRIEGNRFSKLNRDYVSLDDDVRFVSDPADTVGIFTNKTDRNDLYLYDESNESRIHYKKRLDRLLKLAC
ncbi:hypothetical protein [Beijerinckia sp. L45]|uniref:hypothetical protein n=1 Tax=Beijerinckia sp. L45 TaxID=1641855 RepID=UPI00131E5347|nr:hypothetical protein [Beijerinckia sp. L45]